MLRSRGLTVCILLMVIVFGRASFCSGTEKPYKGVRLNYLDVAIPQVNTKLEFLQEFERVTGIKVNAEIVGETPVREKETLDFASGAGFYDMIFAGSWVVPELSPYLEPLDPYVREETKLYPELEDFDINDVSDKVVKLLTYRGHLYALPQYAFGAVLMYREDLFDQYGIAVPRTVDEFTKAAEKLTLDVDGDGNIDIYGFVARAIRGEENPIWSSGWWWAFGLDGWFNENMYPQVNAPAAIEATEYFAKLLQKYGSPECLTYTWVEASKACQEGKAAMFLDAGSLVPLVAKREYCPKYWDKFNIALAPKGPAGRRVQCGYSHGVGITNYSKHKRAAWEFLKWLMCERMNIRTLDAAGNVTCPLKSVTDSELYKQTFPRFWKTMAMSIDDLDSRYMAKITDYSEVCYIIGDAVAQVIAGEKDAKTSLDKANKAIYELMKGAGYIK